MALQQNSKGSYTVPTQRTKMGGKVGVRHAIKGQPSVGSSNGESHSRTMRVAHKASLGGTVKKSSTKAGIAGK